MIETNTGPGAQDAPSTYTCRKCGEELYLDDVRGWSELSCPGCSEPIPQEELLLRAGPEEKDSGS